MSSNMSLSAFQLLFLLLFLLLLFYNKFPIFSSFNHLLMTFFKDVTKHNSFWK